ncbi:MULTISPECIES: hypothetical protein [unclassified Brevundimonas]|jgi:hypothetical protein|uniref:hypothetical protein n=1 Tax=Brevundimonas TaxID=41275 RepID=UPI0024150DD8|nr:hypothetical protein [Brevundimonas sp. NCCP 15609]
MFRSGVIYDDWRPSMVNSDLSVVLRPQGCSQYVKNVHAFRAGEIDEPAIEHGLGPEEAEPAQVKP